jgi:hypothetical protein
VATSFSVMLYLIAIPFNSSYTSKSSLVPAMNQYEYLVTYIYREYEINLTEYYRVTKKLELDPEEHQVLTRFKRIGFRRWHLMEHI